MRITEMAFEDRPYEKLLKFGAESLSSSELLAIIIKAGTKNKSALDIAKELMSKDKESIGFYFLNQYSIEELMTIEGIGKVKAIELMAVIEICKRYKKQFPIYSRKVNTPEQLSMIFMNDLQYKKQEILMTALLDTHNRVTKLVTNSIGSINSNSIEIREILAEPIKCQSAKIAIAHNHPSGDSLPSKADIDFTKTLIKACELFGIEFLDHIIVGNGEFSSLRKLGII